MGKRQLGEMQPFELVITLLIADIVALPMTQMSMPILFGFVPLTMLVIIHFFVSLLARKSVSMRKLINGKPVIVVSPQGISYDALKELNMSMDDLMEGIRSSNFFSLDDVLYAIVETNGVITVLPKKTASPVTVEDMKLQLPENTLPVILISAGKVVDANLNVAKIDAQFIQQILEKASLKDVSEVLICAMDTEGEVFLETFDGKTQNLKMEFEGNW